MDTVTIIRCLHIIEQMNLKGKEIFKDFTIGEIEKIYNGIGPDRFPEWLRNIVTMANGLFEPAALIHDLRYHIGGTKADFTAANDEFRENCYTLVNAAYAWYDPRRYKWLFRAWRYAGYCEEFGWEGYHRSVGKDTTMSNQFSGISNQFELYDPVISRHVMSSAIPGILSIPSIPGKSAKVHHE